MFKLLYAARLSGSTVDAMEELDDSSEDTGFVGTQINRMKRWLVLHSERLNFWTILALASVSLLSFSTYVQMLVF